MYLPLELIYNNKELKNRNRKKKKIERAYS